MGESALPLTIFTFLHAQPERWKALRYSEYTAEHVNALYRALKENLKIPHRFVCITDNPKGIMCETIRCWSPTVINGHDSCYRRLRMFSPWFQNAVGTEFMALMDLDVVLLGDVTPAFEFAMQHDFAIMRGSKSISGTERQVNWYNGGFWVSRIGARDFWRHVQDKPRIEKLQRIFRMPDGQKAIGSDQVLISIISGPDEATIGPEHGVAQFRHWRGSVARSAKLVFFAGSSKPWSNSTRHTHPQLFEGWQRYRF
jgi:hypothetical protein